MLCAAICCPALAGASDDGPLHLDGWGIYSTSDTRMVADAAATSGKHAVSLTWHLETKTRDICAALGTTFGIQFTPRADRNQQPLDLTIEVHHPKLRNHFGGLQSIDAYTTTADPGFPHWSAWTFADRRNMVAGLWRFLVLRDGRTLLDQTFRVRFACDKPVS